MAGPACKILINNSVAAIMQGLERVLTSPLVRDVLLSSESCNDLVQALADLDIRTYNGTPVPEGRPQSLLDVIERLEDEGVFTNEVWQILASKPPMTT